MLPRLSSPLPLDLLTRSACCSWSLVRAVTGAAGRPGGNPSLCLEDVDPARAGLELASPASAPATSLLATSACCLPVECARPASGAPLPIPCISCSSTQRRVGEGGS